MPIYIYWGNDDFAIAHAVTALRQTVLDAAWESFNYDKIAAEQPDAVTQALNQALTPPFGAGGRLVWLVDTPLCQRCSEDQLSELERTLPALPDSTTLLMTSSSKPDSRLKSTKLLQKHAEIREFALIPAWKTDLVAKNVRQVAQEIGVKLTPAAIDLLAEALGNDTRQLYSELEKLRLYAGKTARSLTETDVAALVTASTQSSFKLGAAIRQGETAEALELVAELLRQNEPALRIVSSLVGQFRTWTWVKLMVESGERDETAIAQAAEIGNPKRLYFLKQETQSLSSSSLLQTLPMLLELEADLKRGADDLISLQTKVIQLCELCRKR
ncbi:MAG: DNA polymerase III subunit delta [Oscillatoriales cyanobacterium C42_A2020_001]|nr:DNA polymerase III subunit delta [Leptolyngbyaceae cyanobacterium C42_A2020_001]